MSVLATLKNSFEEEHRGRCFNHTLDLFAKALVKPFNPVLSGKAPDDVADLDEDMPTLEDPESEDDSDNGDELEDLDELASLNDAEDSHDELEELDEVEWEDLLERTTVVRESVTKAS